MCICSLLKLEAEKNIAIFKNARVRVEKVLFSQKLFYGQFLFVSCVLAGASKAGWLKREQLRDRFNVFLPIRALQQVVQPTGRPSPKQDREMARWSQLQSLFGWGTSLFTLSSSKQMTKSPNVNPFVLAVTVPT